MAARFASLFLISRFQAELDRLFQEALQIGESDLPLGEWQPPHRRRRDAGLDPDPGRGAGLRGRRPAGRGARHAHRSSRASSPPRRCPAPQRIQFHCLERGHGRFSREVQIFAPVNTHKGTARLADGLLTIEFPKIEDKRQRLA